jgi:hypothetical protein
MGLSGIFHNFEGTMRKITWMLIAAVETGLLLFSEPIWAEKPAEPQAVVSTQEVSARDIEQGADATLAYAKDTRADIPTLTQPDHFVKSWQPVTVQPQVPDRFPEELERTFLPSPDPIPAGLAWDGKTIWVAGRKACKLFQIDPQTGAVLTSIPSPGDFPTGLAFDGRILWHTDEHARTLYGIEQGSVTKKFVLDWPCAGVAVTPEGLIISDSEKALLRVVSPENGKVIDTIPAPDAAMAGLAFDGAYLWCSQNGYIIVHDLLHKRPINSFAVTARAPDKQHLGGLAFTKDRLYYSDMANGKIVSLATPRHGQHIAAGGIERNAVFVMSVRNTSDSKWPRDAFLTNVPIYEMPGQRFLQYRITPTPVAHYRDSEGNLHALIAWDGVEPGEGFQVAVHATIWSADRWTFIDPKESSEAESEPLKSICADKQGGIYPIDSDFVLAFLQKAVGDGNNPYWRFRLAHDAFVAQTNYVEPADQSVKGVLETGKGVCRHFSNVLVTLGRNLKVPMLDAWAPHHNLCCVWIHGAGWVFVEPTINITSKSNTILSSCRWFNGLPRDELTTGVAGPALQGDLLVDGTPFIPGRHCRFPKDLPGFRNEVEWQAKNKNDRNNANLMFPAFLRVRQSGDEIRLNWEEAVDLEEDAIEYAVETKSDDGQWLEVGRTKENQFGFVPKDKVVSVRIAAIDGHHEIASAPRAECGVPSR